MRFINKIALSAVLASVQAQEVMASTSLQVQASDAKWNLLPSFLKEEFDDRQKDFKQICEEHSYGYEKHEVHTQDGYILQLDRVLPKNGLKAGSPVVLFQHGIEDSAIQWVINSEDKSPAFILSQAGFDVWVGNNRGNDFSIKHETLTTKDKAFWDFDWEQMGTEDIPAFVDYILKQTETEKLDAYIGHSEGTTQFFAGASLKPDYYADKVKLFVGCAPVVRLDHTSNGGMKFASQIINPLTSLIETLGIYDLISVGNTPQWAMGKLCGAIPRLCQLLDQGIVDWSGEVDNLEREGDKFAHSPAGSGWRNLVHYGQVIKAKQFQRYDFGSKKNHEVYGQEQPPAYNLSAISTPMALFHGDIDELADPTDVAWLLDESQSGLRSSMVVHSEQLHFAHNTFSIGKNMTYVHDTILPLVEKAHNGTLY